MSNIKAQFVTSLMMMGATTSIHAAALERSSQQIDALFEAGTYAEISYAHISPNVTGQDTSKNTISDMAEDFQTLNYAVKTDLTPNMRLAVLYDEPFGAKAGFEGDNNFIEPSQTGDDARTRVNVKSRNITTLLGYNLNPNLMIYAGPALQELNVDVHLRGPTYAAASGYNNHFSEDLAWGWVAGLSYAKPELGILASLTYRSEIEHKTTIYEDVPLADLVFEDYSHANTGSVTTPESVNLNLQTGLNMTTVLFAKMRYVPWSNFEYRPPMLNAATAAALKTNQGLPLVDYSKDQTAVELGIGKKVLPNLALSVSGLWDSGAGNPVTTLGPVEGYWGVGLGAKYNLNEQVALGLGGRFLWFGDAKGKVSDGRIVGDFQDNTGYVIGAKLSYQMK